MEYPYWAIRTLAKIRGTTPFYIEESIRSGCLPDYEHAELRRIIREVLMWFEVELEKRGVDAKDTINGISDELDS